jgi:RNA polymerase sigma factor (sigma-70 family)
MERAIHICMELDDITTVYRRHHRALHAFLARGSRVSHEADDLAQEVYLRLARMGAAAAPLRSPKAFLFKTATNLLRDRSRRSYTRMSNVSVSAHDVEIQDTSAEPSRVLESRQQLSAVARAVEALKPATQRAFLLNRLEAKSYTQIAAEMGISISMVEKHVSAAIAVLRAAQEC